MNNGTFQGEPWSSKFIGKRYRVANGLYGEDVLTVVGKEPGFGALFHSEKTNKKHHVYDYIILREVS